MSWSLSSLGTYEKCAKKYEYKYILRLPEARHSAASRGVELHKAVEDFVAGTIQKLPAEIDFYTQFLTGLRQHEIYPEHKISLDREWNKVEWDDKEKVWYKGVLDLKLIDPGTGEGSVPGVRGDPTSATVYDWKTGKIYPDHDDQKTIYSLGVFSEHPTLQRVRAIHVYLDLGKSREVTFHRDQVHQLRELWVARVSELENAQGFPPNPSYMCRYCAFSRANGGPCRF